MRQHLIPVFGAILGGHLWICMHYMDPGDHDFCKRKRLLYTNARIFTLLRATLDAGPRPIEDGPNLKHKLDPRRQIGPRSRISWLIGKMFQIKLGNSRNVENCLLGFSLHSQSIGPMFTSQWSSKTKANCFGSDQDKNWRQIHLCNPGASVIISGFVIGLGPESKVVNEFDFEALSANTINCSRVN